MRKSTGIAIALFVCGAFLLFCTAASSVRPNAPMGFGLLTFFATVAFFFAGIWTSVSSIRKWWKQLKALSLLPLVLTIAFVCAWIVVVNNVSADRNLFFRSHFSEYQHAVTTLENKGGQWKLKGRYSLPREFRHLANEGTAWVEPTEGTVNYYFVYAHGLGALCGALYAPGSPQAFDFEIVIPMKGHPGWYWAGY